MPDPGKLTVRLRAPPGERPRLQQVDCRRPDVARTLCGRDAEGAVALVPLLYSVCGRAQGLAARLALAAARGEELSGQVDPAAAQEAAREHAWRLFLDWPQALGQEAQRQRFIEVARDIASRRCGALQEPGWLQQIDSTRLRIPQLPLLEAHESLEELPSGESGLIRFPLWRGQPAETGAWARSGGGEGSARDRVLARLQELRDHLAGRATGLGAVSSVCIAPGKGRALVQTARGLLIHELRLQDGCVDQYAIVAPTEWNFHPDGPLIAAMNQAAPEDGDSARRFICHIVGALDPCVAWEMQSC